MRIFIFGYGSIGRRHHKILQKLFPKLEVNIFDPTQNFHDGLVGDYDIGLVCTDSMNHLSCAMKLREHCKLIFVEKPLSTNFKEIYSLTNCFSGLRVHVGCNVRYTPSISRLKQISSRCKIVRITSASDLLSWRSDPNKSSYSFHREKGGGALMDFIHEPDYAFHCFGLPTEVKVIQKRIYADVTVDSDDTCMMLWEYPEKIVSFCLSYASKEYIRKIEVVKDSGESETIEITKSELEESYEKQWLDVLTNGPQNTYQDCLGLYGKILGEIE